MVAESDAALVLAAVAGDRTAFGLLLSRHRPALVRLCLRLTSEPATAEDCAQDACLLAYLRLDRLRSPEAFGAWLNGIGRHTCYHAVEAHRQGSTPLTAVLDLAASETGSPVVAVTHSELSRDLRTAVGELPAAQRVAVRVFYLDGLSHSEAADTLGISVSALKVRLHDARRTLKHRHRLDEGRRQPYRGETRVLSRSTKQGTLYFSGVMLPQSRRFRSSPGQRFGSGSQRKPANNSVCR